MPRIHRKAIPSPEPAAGETALSIAPSGPRLTKRNLAKFQEKVLFENIEPMLTESFAAIRKGIREGNVKFVQLAVEIGGIVNTTKTPTIINQVYAKSESRSEAAATAEIELAGNFESLARKLDARDAAMKAGEIIDVSVLDDAG